ncbi:MAG: PIN domain-containing protein [Planctomycetes bacterium]|nr:PIN domain-containing protein [Planctomycetota bacterium]
MMLVDAGPLVALLRANDTHHAACVQVVDALEEPLASVWPVVVEAMYLLGYSWQAQDALWEMIQAPSFRLLPLEEGDLPRMRELMRKYRDLPMDLADAALVRVAERENCRRVFTLDRRDFACYRPARMGHFVILP